MNCTPYTFEICFYDTDPHLARIRDDIPHERLSMVSNRSIIQQNVNESYFYNQGEVTCGCTALCKMPERILEHKSEYSGNYTELIKILQVYVGERMTNNKDFLTTYGHSTHICIKSPYRSCVYSPGILRYQVTDLIWL